jgi:hypothetical protein
MVLSIVRVDTKLVPQLTSLQKSVCLNPNVRQRPASANAVAGMLTGMLWACQIAVKMITPMEEIARNGKAHV